MVWWFTFGRLNGLMDGCWLSGLFDGWFCDLIYRWWFDVSCMLWWFTFGCLDGWRIGRNVIIIVMISPNSLEKSKYFFLLRNHDGFRYLLTLFCFLNLYVLSTGFWFQNLAAALVGFAVCISWFWHNINCGFCNKPICYCTFCPKRSFI